MASIHHRPDRKLPWRVIWREPGTGKQTSKSFATNADAKAHKATVEVELGTGEYVPTEAGAVTIATWAEYCTAEVWTVRPSTVARNAQTLKSMILPAFGHMRLDSVAHADVQAWVKQLEREGYAPATVRKAWATLSKLYGTALAGTPRVRNNPCNGIVLPELPHHAARFLTVDQVHTLADAIGPRYRALVYTGAMAGLRAGELFGLRWGNVDLDAGHLDVVEAVKEFDGGHEIGAPKTKRSRRRIPVSGFLAAELADHRRRMFAEGTDTGPDAFVFTAPDGGHIRATNFRARMWKRATVAAGLDGLVLHELRHTAVALWIATGVCSPNQVAARAGHSSVSVVLDRYGHLYPADSARVDAALDAMFARTDTATIHNIADARDAR